MNPAYRRPPAPGGDPSDPGYSTMTPHDDLQQRSSSSSSSHALCLSVGPGYSQYNAEASTSRARHSGKSARKNAQPFFTAGSNNDRSRGLSSQPEEESDDERESSSTSGIFKGLASSSLLSGNHEPPKLNWSPEEVQQYFGDFDAARCSECGASLRNNDVKTCSNCGAECGVREKLIVKCAECGAVQGRSNNTSCSNCKAGIRLASSCSRCGKRDEDCGCKRSSSSANKQKKSTRRREYSSDGIESDLNSDVSGATCTSYPATTASYTNAQLSSPKAIGLNRIVVPVTVHMVDSL